MSGFAQAGTAVPVKPRGGPATHALNRGLDALAKQRRHPPCAIPEIFHYWVSDSESDRAIAIRGCHRCTTPRRLRCRGNRATGAVRSLGRSRPHPDPTVRPTLGEYGAGPQARTVR